MIGSTWPSTLFVLTSFPSSELSPSLLLLLLLLLCASPSYPSTAAAAARSGDAGPGDTLCVMNVVDDGHRSRSCEEGSLPPLWEGNAWRGGLHDCVMKVGGGGDRSRRLDAERCPPHGGAGGGLVRLRFSGEKTARREGRREGVGGRAAVAWADDCSLILLTNC